MKIIEDGTPFEKFQVRCTNCNSLLLVEHPGDIHYFERTVGVTFFKRGNQVPTFYVRCPVTGCGHDNHLWPSELAKVNALTRRDAIQRYIRSLPANFGPP